MAKQVLNNSVTFGEQRGKINDNFTEVYNAIANSAFQLTVSTITERNALDISKVGMQVFVTDDGDGKWALYRANQTGVSANYTKLNDQDYMSEIVSNAQVKTAYESNTNTNAFTDILKTKLENSDVQVYKDITANTILDNSYHNAIVYVKGNVTVTLPAGLRSDFNCVALCFKTFIGTYAIGAGATNSAQSDGLTHKTGTMVSIMKNGAENYIIKGTE